MPDKIAITSRKIAITLVCIIAFLLIANLTIIYLKFVKGYVYFKGFIHAFYFDNEANFPSLYSALAIMFSAFLLWRIGSSPIEAEGKRSRYWKFVALIFVFLAVDEFVSIHELLLFPARNIVKRLSLESDYLLFAWFIPYSLLAFVVAIVFFRLFSKLPARTRGLFISAGVVFLSGAVGMEMVSSKYWAVQGWNIDHSDDIDLTYALIVTAEELLEMLGIVIFVYALTHYFLRQTGRHLFLVSLSDSGETEQTERTEVADRELQK